MISRRHLLACCLFCLPLFAHAGLLDAISTQDASKGLRQALEQGAGAAVANLGVEGGFQGNPEFRIPLPDTIKKLEPALRMMGQGKAVDDLHQAMNRAAEVAVAEAKPLLINAVRQMTVQDAKNILTGGDDSVTQYFRSKTIEPLTQKFLPIVSSATQKVKLAERYNRIASQGAALGLVRSEDARIEDFVTRHALDALYIRIGEEERQIRAHPAEAIGSIARKVFGAM
ncbi:DUF4197 domain-containing protein [Uliginosibacterium gangwonense]|uniref:DUF4197 domain-containing protein n=1 Tax=Uliginosibacterium gangwonense TaxID=392736 RepID=UPI000367FDC6|nr:DUF4197 domain-containing protein [Uliginosibacterium gangwonense]